MSIWWFEMKKRIHDSPETMRCVICLCSSTTMLSLETPIDVEGIQICCGAIYRKFIGLEENAMVNIKQDGLKLCLSCLTQLNTSYLFQQRAVESFDYLLNCNARLDNSTDPDLMRSARQSEQLAEKPNDEISDCIEDVSFEEYKKYQYQDDFPIKSSNFSNSEMEHCLTSSITNAATTEEYLNEPDEFEIVEEIIDGASSSNIELNVEYMDENQWIVEKDESVIGLSGNEESDSGYVRHSEQDSAGGAIKVAVIAEQAAQCAICAQGMDTITSFRKHFLKEHCIRGASHDHMHCAVCKRNFKSVKSFVQHLPKHRANKQYVCQFCPKSFHYQHHRRNHEQTHRKERPFSCDQCLKTFTTRICLENHQSQHEAHAKHVCEMCPSRFKSAKCLRKHHIMKHNVAARYFEPFACKNCGKMLYSQSAATYHSKLQCCAISGGKFSWLIRCFVCKQQFESRAQLEQHLEAEHSAEDHLSYIKQNSSQSSTYECDVCGRRFSQSVILRRHKLRHEGIKPHQCDQCQRSFTQKATLKNHLRTHTNEKPFVCHECGGSFRATEELRRHRLRGCTNEESVPHGTEINQTNN